MAPAVLYLDQHYLSGFAKRKPAFRELSQGRSLPDRLDRSARDARRRMLWTIEHDLPERRARPSDAADLDALALALIHCDLITCDAFMADVVHRDRLDVGCGCELFTGRRADVVRLRDRLHGLAIGRR